MAGSRHAFKLSNAKRLVQAAIAGGLPRDQLCLVHDPLKQTIRVEVRDGNSDEAANPWLADLDKAEAKMK